MKISSVAISDLKQYANVYITDDDNLFSTILVAGKSFISTYTGLPLVRVSNVPIVNPVSPGAPTITGTGTDGYTITATLMDNSNITATVPTGGNWTLTIPAGETLNNGDVIPITQTSTGGVVSAPTSVLVSKVNQALFPHCMDDYEDLTVVLFVLSNEMYDNRSLVVDNDKINFVVKQILDSYSVNLL